jgi:hypothetical protein
MRRARLLSFAAVLALAASGSGRAQTYTTIRNSGPASNRVDLALIGDGYTASELGTTYVTHAQSLVDYMFTNRVNDPYPRYANFFNVHRVSIASNQSGADNPATGVVRDTALDATYRYDGVTDRLLYFSTSKATTAINTTLSGSGITPDMRVGLVNDSTYGGGGGYYAVYAAGNSSSRPIATHEIGHSFAKLADEYDYGGSTTYTGSEPGQANITKDSTGAKWSRWLGYTDPAHTSIDAVGTYEGANYSQHGIYRPTSDSMMRDLGVPLNAIGREQTILNMYKYYVDPLDSYKPNSLPLTNPADLWVDAVDPAVINVDWYVNGSVVLDNGPESLHLANLALSSGTYTITARAYDSVLDLENTGRDYDWVRTGESYLQQSVSWTVSVPEPASALLAGIAAMVLLCCWRKMKLRIVARAAPLG